MIAAKKYLYLIGISSLVVALDQWTKYLVRSRLQFGESWAPWQSMGAFLRIVHWNNTGSAFGLFPSAGMVFTLVAVVVIIAILIYFPRIPSNQVPLRMALSLQFGGAIGNLIDRVAFGRVTDFIAVGSIPVFNVADSGISIGVAILIVAMLFEPWSSQGPAAGKSPIDSGESPSGSERENGMG